MAEEVCKRLRTPNDVTAQVVDLVRGHLRFMNLHQMRPGTLMRFLRRPNFEDHLELHRVDCLSSHGDLEYYEFAKEKYAALQREPPPPRRLLSGDDLIGMGYAQGPIFRQILESVEDLQLEHPQLDREQALDFVRRQFPLEKSSGESTL